MPSVTFGARANGLVVLDMTFGAYSTNSIAWVDALEIEASLVATTFFMSRAFPPTTALNFL